MSNSEARVQRLERILEVSRDLTSTLALEPLLHKIVRVAAELTGCNAASILLVSAHTGELRFRAASDDASGQLSDILVPIDNSIAGDVLLSGEPAIISDVHMAPRHYGVVGRRIGLEIRSLLAVPMQIRDRRIGVLEAVNKHRGEAFCGEDVETLTALATQAAAVIENARLVGALQDAHEQLGHLEQLKSDFIAVASHELRTPLSLILGYASYLEEDADPESARKMRVVVRAAARLQHIIETMLNLRYLEIGEMQLKVTGFDLRDEVLDVCRAYEALAKTNKVVLETDLPRDEVLIWADREKLRVVLDNLVSNAVKFNLAGGRVLVAVHHLENEVVVRVTDTGVGIPAKDLDRIFSRFSQLEDLLTRRHEGIGLGLSIVKGLVECHGGRVWAESTPGQGSCFSVALPKRAAPAEAPGPLADRHG